MSWLSNLRSYPARLNKLFVACSRIYLLEENEPTAIHAIATGCVATAAEEQRKSMERYFASYCQEYMAYLQKTDDYLNKTTEAKKLVLHLDYRIKTFLKIFVISDGSLMNLRVVKDMLRVSGEQLHPKFPVGLDKIVQKADLETIQNYYRTHNPELYKTYFDQL